jgi:protein pelota|tara:strand:+ start:77 stop:1228 length:1152 start_codon:yes stop_codon:yes gene_type:complete
MRLLRKKISSKDGEGSVTLIADEPEDVWHIFNLLSPDDRLRTTTFRKVVSESSTGSTKSEKRRVTLTVMVETVDYDGGASTIRVSGRNVEENDFVQMGAFHTVDVAVGRKLELFKPCWDAMFLERLATACDASKSAEVAAVVMELGLAHVCLLTTHMTVVRSKIEMSIPKKRRGSESRRKGGVGRFFAAVLDALLRSVDLAAVKCVLIASPGFVKDDFHKFIFAEAASRPVRELFDNRDKFVLCKSANGHLQALKEVLASEGIARRLADTMAAREVAALVRFFRLLDDDPDRAYYGVDDVQRACEMGAIETLLVTDSLFRSCELAERRRYIALVESARASGATVMVCSTQHVSGAQLETVGGVAALLRFPVPEFEEEDEGDET